MVNILQILYLIVGFILLISHCIARNSKYYGREMEDNDLFLQYRYDINKRIEQLINRRDEAICPVPGCTDPSYRYDPYCSGTNPGACAPTYYYGCVPKSTGKGCYCSNTCNVEGCPPAGCTNPAYRFDAYCTSTGSGACGPKYSYGCRRISDNAGCYCSNECNVTGCPPPPGPGCTNPLYRYDAACSSSGSNACGHQNAYGCVRISDGKDCTCSAQCTTSGCPAPGAGCSNPGYRYDAYCSSKGSGACGSKSSYGCRRISDNAGCYCSNTCTVLGCPGL